MTEPSIPTLYSGGATGAEEAFGRAAERCGLDEVTFTFEGHVTARTRGLRELSPDDLSLRDVSVQYVTKLMRREYPTLSEGTGFRGLLQSICWQVASGQEIFVVGEILPDKTVRGGTGWGAEFAKLCNKPLFVYDQQRQGWFKWDNGQWAMLRFPCITRKRFTGTGTRSLTAGGEKAIEDLFQRSFG